MQTTPYAAARAVVKIVVLFRHLELNFTSLLQCLIEIAIHLVLHDPEGAKWALAFALIDFTVDNLGKIVHRAGKNGD